MAVTKLMLAAALSTAVLAAPVLEERQACSGMWGQCGGIGYTGPTCCDAGSSCLELNPYYSQCLAGDPVDPEPTDDPTTAIIDPDPTPTGVDPDPTVGPTPTGGPGAATWSGNPFADVDMWANDYYRSEVHTLAMPQLSPAMATAAAKVAEVPSFEWMDTYAKIPRVRDSLQSIREANSAGGNNAGLFVVYDLPDRDCAAAASNGEYAIADGGVAKYKNYIDEIRKMLIDYEDVRSLLIIEPDSLANMVTNLNVPKCANARAAYEECTIYALKNLNLPNVAMYMDFGHAGWLGWPANQDPAADLFANIYKAAGSPSQVRGLATNVANYNSYDVSSPPSYTSQNSIWNEKMYIEALGPKLASRGFPAHFVVDQGRSGKQPTGQSAWGEWCNQIGTGFGTRPAAVSGGGLLDAFVWIKPGGESDGTSDTSADRYDYHCGSSSSVKPAPEAGQWFQAYFEQLLTNANPSFM